MLTLALGITACGGSDSSPTTPSPAPEPLQPTFTSIRTNVLSVRCVACHSGSGAPEGLNLEANVAYLNLVNARSAQRPALLRVAPGSAETSYLIHKLDGRSDIAGLRMPQGGPFLSTGDIQVIRTWIDQGAQNN
jgi:hypothetical protein